MRLIALRRFDDVEAGQEIERSERVARQLMDRRLVQLAVEREDKMAATPQNQMRPAPLGKASTAGRDQPSSASPAAPASPQTTASLFEPGVSPAKRTRKGKADESSSSTPASD